MRSLIVILFLLVVIDPYKGIRHDELVVVDLTEERREMEMVEPEPPAKEDEEIIEVNQFYCGFCSPPQYISF